MRTIIKSFICDVKLSDKDNHSGPGRPLTYPKDVENELIACCLDTSAVRLTHISFCVQFTGES